MYRAFLLAAILFSAEIGAAQAGGWHAVAFMYHRFGEDNYPSTSVTLEQFDAHLEYLEEEDYNVWPIERIVDAIENGEEVPDRTVAITIDDAYRSVYEEAYPRLKERGWPYSVFAATDPIDDGLSGYMTWDQMREMQEDSEVTFANHTATHDYLVRREEGESDADYEERLRDDVQRGQTRLEAELGEENIPMVHAYPYGEYNRTVAEVIDDLGYTALGQQSGAISPYSDTLALPRFAMAEAFADIDEFSEKAGSRALPVEELDPWDPVAANDDNPPRMRITLAESDARLDQLACFVSRQGAVEIEWVDRDARVFEVEPPEELGTGRTRYNCTAPSPDRGRFYWFSQQWIVLPD